VTHVIQKKTNRHLIQISTTQQTKKRNQKREIMTVEPAKFVVPPCQVIGDLDLSLLLTPLRRIFNSNNLSKFPGTLPVSVSHKHIEDIRLGAYVVTPKADGVRVFIYINNTSVVAIRRDMRYRVLAAKPIEQIQLMTVDKSTITATATTATTSTTTTTTTTTTEESIPVRQQEQEEEQEGPANKKQKVKMDTKEDEKEKDGNIRPATSSPLTVLDCEMMAPGKMGNISILVFDALLIDGVSVIDQTFEDRHEAMRKWIHRGSNGNHNNADDDSMPSTQSVLSHLEMPSAVPTARLVFGENSSSSMTITLTPKSIYPSYHLPLLTHDHNSSFVTDGYILMRRLTRYSPFRCDPLACLKWKPIHDITVDFKVVSRQGVVYICTGFTDDIYEIVDTRVFGPFTGYVVECRFFNNIWVPIRLRTDKTCGNDICTVEATVDNILNEIKIEDLY
jgi:hypothetical protein